VTLLIRFRLSAGGAGKSAPKHGYPFEAILGKISIAMLLQMVRARYLRVTDVVEIHGCYKMAQKIWGNGPPTGRRAPWKKVPNLQFCHFGPYSGQRVAETLWNVGKLFTVSSTTYNVL